MSHFARRPRIHHETRGDGFRVRDVSYVPNMRQAPHAHESTGITLVLAGGIRETVGKREEVAQVLSVVVKPAGVVHADEVGPEGARTIQVLLDADRIGAIDPGIGAWRWMHGGPGARPLLELGRLLRTGDRRGGGLDDTVHEVLGDVTGPATARHADPPSWLRRARETLDDTLPETISVAELATLSDVHPVSLTRAFRRHYGVSVTGYRRRERVRRAAREIEDTSDELTRIAYRAGFADHPHMCREIRAATGLTPTELREMARG